ncbi:dipeptide epimerase [Halomarina oriensis]|uniref:Dipeptide epimerase n=1 Tax=Halomarina oriensis TaxID=671145 RepID=A0A6B0GJH8_9EURY|nr:dipeptide epimerase [Halomarina oriensis]MWG35076.1 dipeptide epimerase [Halomarina oriensis]
MTDLTTAFERVELPLETPFTISRGTQHTAANVVVRIEDGEHVGVGAAAPSRHYGETAATVEAVLPELLDVVEEAGDPLALDRIDARIDGRIGDNPAAKAAVRIACCDLAAKRLDVPLYRLFGLDGERTVTSSFTVGIDDPERMGEKTRTAVDAGYTVLKTKLGTDDDEARLAAVREAAPDARIRVDANEAWTPREAVDNCEWLASYDVEFCEQPVPAEDPDGLRYVYERSAVPIAADESCVTLADLPRIADACDVANVKLMKCGGPRQAVEMFHAARAHGLETMLGCMIETNAAIAAAAHLAPLLDYADLDGSLLLDSDPYEGVPMPTGLVDCSALDRPGTGARRA